MSNKIFLLLIFSLFFILCGANRPILQDPAALKNSLLWEITGNDLQVASYLYGTIHLICQEDLELPETVLNALQKTEILALELDMSDPNFSMEFQKGMVMQDGSNLRKLLSREDYQLLTKFFNDSLDIDLQQVEVVKPFYMNSMLYPRIIGCQPQPYELELVRFSALNSIPITGLGTIHQQKDLFSNFSYKKQALMLVEAIKNLKRTQRMYQKLLSYYKKQDVEGAHEWIKSNTSGLQDFEESFLKENNNEWIPKIEELLAEKSAFIAVGAGHLGGENGLIKLLKDRGYTVTPVSYSERFQLPE